jgi:hypothetical protein
MLQAGNPTAAAAAAATTAGALLRAAVSDFTKGRSNDTITSRGSAAPASMTALLGIYTGWIGRDNLGDEVVADIFFDLLVEAVRGRACGWFKSALMLWSMTSKCSA